MLNNIKLLLDAATLDLIPLFFLWIRLQADQVSRQDHALCGLMSLDFRISGY